MVTPVPHPRRRVFHGAAPRAVPEVPLAVRCLSRQLPVPDRGAEPAVPTNFLCPISLEMMRDPVTAPTGITYDRDSVEGWLERGHNTCPVTGRPLRLEELIPNHATRRVIQEWCVANRTLGVERVPTPRVPISAVDASELLVAVSSAVRRGDASTCRELLGRVRALGKENERNRRCFASAGAARALSTAFSHLSSHPTAMAAFRALEEILATLVVYIPLDEEARRRIASPAALDSIVSILSHGDLPARVSAVVLLREIASSADGHCLDAMSKTKRIYGTIVNLLEKPVSPQATKAALVTAYYLITYTEHAASLLVDLGMLQIVVELLVDSDRGTTEKALAVLDSLLLTDKGRVKAYAQALAVPVIVKKMHHVSDMATEFAVSALWRLCKNDPAAVDGRGCRTEALQVGAFQKLLLLLQTGCEGVTKDRASELLRLLNGSRHGGECIDTVDFKSLKRPF